jgi:hypothetical protein
MIGFLNGNSAAAKEKERGLHEKSLLTHLLTHSLTPWCRILFEKLIVTQLIKKYPAFFMEPKVSLLCSQKPATGPYPEPAESSLPH